jgi:hypothetical protein
VDADAATDAVANDSIVAPITIPTLIQRLILPMTNLLDISPLTYTDCLKTIATCHTPKR